MKKIIYMLLVLLFCAAICRADDVTAGQQGRTVFPMQNTDIEMVSEDIVMINTDTITEENRFGKWEVSCVYKFHNTGKACEILIGFPGKEYSYSEYNPPPEITDFKAWIDGKEVQVSRMDGGKKPVRIDGKEDQVNSMDGGKKRVRKDMQYTVFYTFKASFKENETKTIEHTFSCNNRHGHGKKYFRLGFVLRTGALWKGPIGKVNVTAKRVFSESVNYAEPEGYKSGDYQVSWEMTDVKPDEDIALEYCFDYGAVLIDFMNQDKNFIMKERKEELKAMLLYFSNFNFEDYYNIILGQEPYRDAVTAEDYPDTDKNRLIKMADCLQQAYELYPDKNEVSAYEAKLKRVMLQMLGILSDTEAKSLTDEQVLARWDKSAKLRKRIITNNEYAPTKQPAQSKSKYPNYSGNLFKEDIWGH